MFSCFSGRCSNNFLKTVYEQTHWISRLFHKLPEHRTGLQQIYAHQIYFLSTIITDQSILSGFLSVIFIVRDTEGGGVYNRCYPLTLENMAEGPDVWMTSQPWDQLMWQWWRWVLAEETDLVASKVPIFPAFSVLVFTPESGQSWKAGKHREQRKRDIQTQKRKRHGEDWSAVLTVVTDVEFSTKLCQKPSCQS